MLLNRLEMCTAVTALYLSSLFGTCMLYSFGFQSMEPVCNQCVNCEACSAAVRVAFP